MTAVLATDPASGAADARPENRVNGVHLFSLPRVGLDVPFSPDRTRDFPLDVRQIASAKTYAYVSGNPLNGTDASGLCDWYAVAVCGIQGAAGVASTAGGAVVHAGGAAVGAAGSAASWTNNNIIQPTADTLTHLCIRTGGGDWNSNVGGSLLGSGQCQTVLSSAHGVEAEVGVAAVVTGGAGTSALFGSMAEAAAGSAALDEMLGVSAWETFMNSAHMWGGAAFVMGVPLAVSGIGSWMIYNASTSCQGH
jgi:hypothetical protein